ncbi:MAG: 23S rRNA (adenine(2030)-N(6))-methyltransferase RlmJ [Alphaproteobacteria bacterium]|nr:23S rRNA (adenine(2030)-N(6))-methyltransferase RlmJ [Alphaproteobacteria bacterium]
MNYRHIYHAGNFADVIKHLMLMLVIEYMQQKDKPFFLLDTHAGIGLYDLQRVEAQKTAEAADGIARLWNAPDLPPELVRYVRWVRRCNKGDALRYYPGSPLIVQKMLRPIDTMVVNELHPEDVQTLRRSLDRTANLRIESRDGYECIRALLPPPQRRGMVLVDPPFEVRDEFTQMVKGLKDAHERWAGGTYMLWYPIKDPAHAAAFHADIAALNIRDIIAVDFYRRPAEDLTKLNGAGLVVVNPPWTLRASLETALPVLVRYLTAGAGSFAIQTIAAE